LRVRYFNDFTKMKSESLEIGAKLRNVNAV
jgi:hypothetical protein